MRGQAYERLKTTYGDNGHATQDPEVVFDIVVRVAAHSSSLTKVYRLLNNL